MFQGLRLVTSQAGRKQDPWRAGAVLGQVTMKLASDKIEPYSGPVVLLKDGKLHPCESILLYAQV